MTAEKLHDAIGLLPADLIAEADKMRSGRPKVIRWKRYAAMAACFALVLSCTFFASLVLMPKGATETALEYSADMAPAAAAPMEPEAPACEEAPAENSVTGGSGITEDCVREESAEEAAEPDYASPVPTEATFEPVVYPNTSARILTAVPADRSTGTLEIDWAVNWGIPSVLTSREEWDACIKEEIWFASPEWEALGDKYTADWFADKDLVLMPAMESSSECCYTPISLTRTKADVWELVVEETFRPEDNTLDPVYRYVLLEVEKGTFEEDHRLEVIIHTP